jgi:hypothetical protein
MLFIITNKILKRVHFHINWRIKKTNITQFVKGVSVLSSYPYHILVAVFSHSLAKVDSKHSLNFTDVFCKRVRYHSYS